MSVSTLQFRLLHQALSLLAVCCWLFSSAHALGNGQASTPLLGHIWLACTPDQLQQRVEQLRTKLSSYGLLQIGKECFPSSASSASHLGISLGLNLGDDCNELSEFQSSILKAWNISFVSLSTGCMSRPKKGQQQQLQHFFTKKQQAKLRGLAVSVCSTNQADLPWLWAPAVANQWCLPTSTGSDGTAAVSEWEAVLLKLDNTVAMAQFAGRGAWNDLGPLQVGSWSDDEPAALHEAMDRSQFALWAMLKSPLMVAADPEKLSSSSLAVLNNQRLIDVNQDTLGVPGALIWKQGSLELYAGPLSDPADAKKQGRRVVACFNRGDTISSAQGCLVRWRQLGYPPASLVLVENLFADAHPASYHGEYETGQVGPRDVIVLRLTPVGAREATKLKWDMWRPWQQNSELFQMRCNPPGAVMGGAVLMTIAVFALIISGMTFYWVWASPSRKGFQPISSNTKSDEDA